MLRRLLVTVILRSASHARALLLASLICGGFCAYYAATHFAINMNKDHLIWPELPWRMNETAYEKAFPHQQETIIAVLDAPTPELAQAGADRLIQRLNGQSDWIRAAQNIRGSAFFRRNGLLFLSEDELSKTLAAYQRAEPLLSQLASDGSLRGVMGSI